jgi:hypothetical protein
MSDWDWLYWLASWWWVWPLLAGGYGLGYVHGGIVGEAKAWADLRRNPWRVRHGRELDETRYREGSWVDKPGMRRG